MRPRRKPRFPNELWAWAKQIDGYPDTEWTFSVFLSRVTWLESLWPQPFYEYGSTYEDALRLLRFQRELDGAGVPEAFLPVVTLGVEWFDSGLRVPDGRLPMPGSDDPFRGRHRVIASGWDDGGESLVFTNSWGRWGNNGKGLISRDYFEAYADDVYFERSVAIGLNPPADAAFARLGATYSPQELARAWLTPNPPVEGGLIHRGVRTTLAHFTTYSLRGPLVRRVGLNTRTRRLALIARHRDPYERAPSPPPPERHIDASEPGELVQMDCFFIGRLSGSKGSVWQYTAIDVASAYTWAELHSSERNPRSRHCQSLLHRVAHELALAGWKLKTVSTDNGSEFVSSEFGDAVQRHGARQRRIKAGRPTSNGCVERVQQTILEECWRPSFARTLVEIFELRQAGRAIARSHLFHEPERAPSAAVIEELLVHPRFRRRGFASLLEREAARAAAAAGHDLIEIALYEADGRPKGKAARTAFAERARYQWRREGLRRPNRLATAFRTL